MIKKLLTAIIILGVIACSGNSGKELIETATNDNFEEAKLLVEQETDVNANDKDGVTDLIQASENGNLETVKDLVERKRVNINAKTKNGYTALMYASFSGNLEMVKYLVEMARRLTLKIKMAQRL